MPETKTETTPPEVILKGKNVLVVTASPWVGRVCVTMNEATGVEPQLLQSMEEVTEQARETGFSGVDLLIFSIHLPRTKAGFQEITKIVKGMRKPKTTSQRDERADDLQRIGLLTEENAGVALLRGLRTQGVRIPAVLLFSMPSDFDQWLEQEAEVKQMGAVALKIACTRQDLLKTCASVL